MKLFEKIILYFTLFIVCVHEYILMDLHGKSVYEMILGSVLLMVILVLIVKDFVK